MTPTAEEYSKRVAILFDDEIASWRKMPPGSDIPAGAVVRSLEIFKARVEEISYVTPTENSTRLD